ncbi:MAG: PIN domain-containing protein [Candidatus Gottesmanbacteria bacterium]|nr:PIN domain-containing protein [Candidatus Gottesmanbacteria bacterium]
MKSGKKLTSEKKLLVVEEPGALEEPEVPTSWKTMTGTGFTKALAREIVRNLSNLGAMTAKPFQRTPKVETPESRETIGEYPMVVDTSVLIDGRILPMVNSGFIVGTLVIPQVVLGEVQHIADSADSVRRAKGRRGLEVAGKLKGQKANPFVKVKVVNDTVPEVSEVDHKLTALAKRWDAKLVTVDFNLAQYARAQGIKVLNINDLAQALKMAIVPGEELTIKITHEGKEREQGVGYLSDGTMIVIDQARALVGTDATVVITKIHQTPAGQLFFGRLK